MNTPLTPGFMLLQSNRMEDLRDVMVKWIMTNPLRPLENECILVQSNGIAQWLKMALASDTQGCGIAAAMQVDLPGRFLWLAYRSVFDDLPLISPFDKQPLAWRIYRLLGNLEQLQQRMPNPACLKPLEGFLTQDTDPRRLHQLAANLADLYDQYQVYRADWLTGWEVGSDDLINAQGQHKPLDDEQLWQPALWRLLVEDIQQDNQLDNGRWSRVSRAGIHQAFIAACKDFTPTQRPDDLPRRVLVFGISSLPRQTLDLLQAIAPFTQVMIFASNPSQHYWGDLIAGKELLRQEYRRITARKLPANLSLDALHVYGHPLLASWGKQGRDYLHLLDEKDQPDLYRQHFAHQQVDLFSDPGEGCLLHQLQSDILNLTPLTERQAKNTRIDARQDQSLQFLVAHSPQREVEILHDQLLDAFEQAQQQGQPLNPRDVLVMVPDINVYAPHIQAVFGRYANRLEQHDSRFLPFHISDQGQRGQNTLLIALESLLHLPHSRFTVTELLDLLDTPALRLRYGLEESDLPRLRQWIRGANIRWGLDAEQRASLDLPAGLEQNTWLFGLRRMLLGYAVGSSDAWQEIEPYDEVTGLEAALVGPLALLLDNLQKTRQTLLQTHTPEDWVAVIQSLLQTFFVDASPADSQALTTLQIQLEKLQDIWKQGSLITEQLPLEVIREELLGSLDQPSLTQKFLGGSINFATLMPMRAIPFEQVWLLGMNDGDYPRHVRPADFDLMAQDYRPGDRSRREDDRYLFLEALLSARKKLVISWVGRNIRDNSERPPSALVGQLRDHLAAGWQPQSLLADLTTEHPLQPFSLGYFSAGRDPRLFTYADEWRSIHNPQQAVSSAELPPFYLDGAINLNHLAAFLRHPVRSFYAQRLGVRGFTADELAEDEESFSLNGLDQWQIQEQLLQHLTLALTQQPHLLPQRAIQQAAERIQRSGQLPLPPFAEAIKHQLSEELLEPVSCYQQLLRDFPDTLPTQFNLWPATPDGVPALEASLSDIRHNAEGQSARIILQASNLHSGDSYKWYHLVRQWPLHLFAQLQQPVSTVLLGPSSHLCLPPLPATQALEWLLDLRCAWFEGMQNLLPLPCKTAFSLLLDKDARAEYEGGFQRAGEVTDHPALQRFWPDFASLAADPRLADFSQRLYRPLITCLSQTPVMENPINE
ncbi:exodeoxyribonuclease V subunit gamma [Marinospirillum sp.]|uniref:exodeoxyribonuclease V subunit gamma n=1 Tax=Marinospirillum sp. TaxID=2183934 RepID=UPI0025C351ED|nr:exodeoxyribonuclease V subunit gamma [Marinospirillum sp.]